MSASPTIFALPQQRRFDSIATLIQGDDKAGAAILYGKTLLLATNATKNSKLYTAIYQYLQFLVQSSEKALAESKKRPKKIKEIYADLKKDQKNKQAEIEAVVAKTEAYQDNKNEYRDDFRRALRKIAKSVRHSYFPNMSQKIYGDILPDALLKAIRESRIEFVSGEERVHAELKVVQYLLDKNAYDPKRYLGISKRCCLTCERSILALNQVLTGAKSDKASNVRGEGHKKHFPAEVPKFLRECLNVQKAFLSLYGTPPKNNTNENLQLISAIFKGQADIYNNRQQRLEMSDSPEYTESPTAGSKLGAGIK